MILGLAETDIVIFGETDAEPLRLVRIDGIVDTDMDGGPVGERRRVLFALGEI